MSKAMFMFRNFVQGASVVASTEMGSAPAINVQNLQRSQRWSSAFGESSHLDVVLSAPRTATHVALVDVNLTQTGTIHVEAWDDAIEGATQTVDITTTPLLFVDPGEASLPFGEGPFGLGPFGAVSSYAELNLRNVTLVPLPEGVTSQYWRITFADINTSYQTLGVLYIGAALEFTYNLSYGWQPGRDERSPSREALGGQEYVQPRTGRNWIEGDFQYLTDDERTAVLVELRRYGEFRPLLFSLYPEHSLRGLTTTLYGTLSGPALQHTAYDINNFSFRFREAL